MKTFYDDIFNKQNFDFPFYQAQIVFYINDKNTLCEGYITARTSFVELDECIVYGYASNEYIVIKKDNIFSINDVSRALEKISENRCEIKLIKKIKDCPYCKNMPMIVPNSFNVHEMNVIQIKCIKCGVTGPRVETSEGFCETIRNFQELAKLAVEEWNKIC